MFSDVSFAVGSAAELKCIVNADPQPTAQFLVNNNPLSGSNLKKGSSETEWIVSHTFSDFQVADGGTYICHATFENADVSVARFARLGGILLAVHQGYRNSDNILIVAYC